MYPNLDAEMARKGIKRKDLAQLFKGRVPTVSEKLNGKYPLLLDEAVRIRETFFPEYSLEYLFETCDNKTA
ncbi:hypothetical protein [Siminovitchia sp. FSL W7-1587]|uniref:hypothetical protein n=1 Tax=Siminovitchia sp. FSL W7-1587 TaxID=2954699 RepID=UPI0030D2E3DC